MREVQDSKRKVTLSLIALDEKQLNKLKGLYCKIVSVVANCTLLLFLFQYCFEIYSADNSSSLIKACKTDSEGKVVEGLF